jgi:hypothetical protein
MPLSGHRASSRQFQATLKKNAANFRRLEVARDGNLRKAAFRSGPEPWMAKGRLGRAGLSDNKRLKSMMSIDTKQLEEYFSSFRLVF